MKYQRQNTPQLDSDDDEIILPKFETQLTFSKKIQQQQLLEIPLDEEIKGPSYYRLITQAIRDTSEGDIIRFNICSPGGRLDGLMSILSAIWKTDATTEAHIDGFADSVASILSLHCDSVYVSPIASMLVHNTVYGIGGKAADIKAHVDHFNSFSNKLFRDTYKYFLTEDEIEKCIGGYQLYLDADNIGVRLKRKFEMLDKLASEEAEKLSDDNLEIEGFVYPDMEDNSVVEIQQSIDTIVETQSGKTPRKKKSK